MINRRLMLILVAGGILLANLTAIENAAAQQLTAKPLKITVYGGRGAIGSRIVSEALARGHEVTVVDRNPKPATAPENPQLKFVKGDVFDIADVSKNIAGQDVLVTAVAARPAPTRDFYVRLVKGVVAAQRAQTGKKTRFLIVGGAASLLTTSGKRLLDTIPREAVDGSKNEILSMVEALDYLRNVKDVSWSFFSPPRSITPGTRTGKFRVGGDQVILDVKGDSRISTEDYAVAMLDEIEKPQYLNKRFTVGY